MKTSFPADSSKAWSSLWKTGVLHSCTAGFSKNYSGAIGEFWSKQFSMLSDGDSVVDIGTGNGALLLLAKAHASSRGIKLELDGVDAAFIDPPAHAAAGDDFSGIRFHSGTSAGSLPFADHSISLVTSQYAFEYMPAHAVADEIARVLAPRGRAAMVIHSDDSAISATAVLQIAETRFLFEDSDIFDKARALARIMATARTSRERESLSTNPVAENARNEFNAQATRLMDLLLRNERSDILRKAAQYIQQAFGAASQSESSAMKILADAENSLADERDRLAQLQGAILCPAGRGNLQRMFSDRGFTTVMMPLDMSEGVRMGWSLTVEHV